MEVRKGVQVMFRKERRIDEGVRGAGVDERSNRYGRVVGNEEMDQEGEVARLRIGKRGR